MINCSPVRWGSAKEEEAEEGEDPGELFNLDPGSKIIPSVGTRIKPTSVYVTRMSTVYTTVVSTQLMLTTGAQSKIFAKMLRNRCKH